MSIKLTVDQMTIRRLRAALRQFKMDASTECKNCVKWNQEISERLRAENREMKRALIEWCHQNCGGSENESNPCKTCPMRKFTKGGKG